MAELVKQNYYNIIKFDISDFVIINNFLFVSELNYGIFVLILGPGLFVPVDIYLYPLTSAANKIHVQNYNMDEYQLVVSTTLNNEVLIFEKFDMNKTYKASEILKIDRIHAFLLPKYYSFGLINSINDKFLINEMYNSMKKTVSLRISSRAEDTLNDSTLKVVDLTIPISSVIYMGFVECFTNVFLLITSKQISIYSIKNPYILFHGIEDDTQKSIGISRRGIDKRYY